MLNFITLFITTTGTLISFAAILTQFIGAEISTLKSLSLVQLIFLAVATVLAGIIYSRYLKASHQRKGLLKHFFLQMPGWLMFTLLLLIITALLGDLSVLLVRVIGHPVNSLYHVPSLCIVVFCIVYRVIHLNMSNQSIPHD